MKPYAGKVDLTTNPNARINKIVADDFNDIATDIEGLEIKTNQNDFFFWTNDSNFSINALDDTPNVNDITLTWDGNLILSNPNYNKTWYLGAMGGYTIVMDYSNLDYVVYIKQDDCDNTASEGVLPIYLCSITEWGVLKDLNTISLMYIYKTGSVANLNGSLGEMIKSNTLNNKIDILGHKELLLFSHQTSDLSISVFEKYGGDPNKLRIEIVGTFLCSLAGSTKYFSLQSTSTKVFELGLADVMFVRKSDIDLVSDGGVVPVYTLKWQNSELNDPDIIIIANTNKNGRLKDTPGILTDYVRNYMGQSNIQTGNSSDYGIIAGVIRTYAHIPFNNGEVEPLNGDTLVGSTSGASYRVHSVNVTSGSWNSDDASGYVVLDIRSTYLDAPYTDGEILQIAGQNICTVNGNPFGGWQQIDGDHQSINITGFLTTDTEWVTIPHSIGATAICSLVATPDEGWVGYTIGCSVGKTYSMLRIQKLSANISTGAIQSTVPDYSNLANCVSNDNIWIYGILKK